MTSRRLLHFSFLLNALLVMAVLWAAQGWSRRQPTPSVRNQKARTTAQSVVKLRHRRAADTPSRPMPTVAQFSWSQLESTDYRDYIARLRAIGCPESTVRDIILAEINELFRRRVKDLVGTVQGRFWEFVASKDELEKLVGEKEKELDALKEERDGLVAELLGSHTPSLADETAALEHIGQRKQFLDFLPPEKVAQCLALDEKFARLREELSECKPPLAADQRQARSRALDEQQDREFLQLLSPEELAEYNLRNSRFADLRFRLPGFEISEEELREIVGFKMSWLQGSGGQQASANDEIRQLLGEARFADFERAQDNRYQGAYQFTQRLGLPPQTATEVFDAQKRAEELAKQLRADNRVDAAERLERLRELQAEAEQAVARALGSQAFETYRARSGQWLAQLQGNNP